MAKTAKKARAAGGGAALAALPDLPNLPDLPGLPRLPELDDLPPLDELPDLPPISADASSPAAPRPAAGPSRAAGPRGERFITNARDGLRLRAGPDTSFASITTLPLGTALVVIGREGLWAQVDLEGDGVADGFVLASLLKSAAEAEAARPAAAGADILERVTPALVASIFHPQTPLNNIKTHLPFVRAGLRAQGLGDKSMVAMALGTIRAESESFRPIDEGRSQFNTARTPFDLYDAGTSIGRRLGNTVPGDGPKFKGRGFVQLTGRDNYTKIGAQLGQPLVSNPQLANDPTIAGLILATFLKNKESAVRAALAANDLRKARKLVNGGSHGFDRFKDTFVRGTSAL